MKRKELAPNEEKTRRVTLVARLERKKESVFSPLHVPMRPVLQDHLLRHTLQLALLPLYDGPRNSIAQRSLPVCSHRRSSRSLSSPKNLVLQVRASRDVVPREIGVDCMDEGNVELREGGCGELED